MVKLQCSGFSCADVPEGAKLYKVEKVKVLCLLL